MVSIIIQADNSYKLDLSDEFKSSVDSLRGIVGLASGLIAVLIRAGAEVQK